MFKGKSWRTTTLGIIAVITALLGFVRATIDGDPTTEPDMAALSAAVAAGLGLLFARDSKANPPEGP